MGMLQEVPPGSAVQVVQGACLTLSDLLPTQYSQGESQ